MIVVSGTCRHVRVRLHQAESFEDFRSTAI